MRLPALHFQLYDHITTMASYQTSIISIGVQPPLVTIDRFKTLKDANDHNGLKNYGLHKSEELAKLMFEGTIILLRLRKEVQILFGLKRRGYYIVWHYHSPARPGECQKCRASANHRSLARLASTISVTKKLFKLRNKHCVLHSILPRKPLNIN